MGKIVKAVVSPFAAVFGTKAALQFAAIAVNFIPGIGQLASLAITTALSIGSSLLASKPKSPRVSTGDRDRLFVSINPRAPRTMVFGQTAMATDIRDQEFTGTDKEFLHRFIVVASHKCQAIEEIWFDDKLAWSVGGGVQGEYAGYLTVTPILEGSAGNAVNISARMGTTRRYTGCAYVHLRYKLTGNSKKSDSPFAQSIPSRMTIIGKGIACYDPRLDSTVGGSGTQRANDQSTWGWSDSASRNTKLQELTYLLGWKINGKLAVGKGIPPARIDIASYITAANACDESVSLAAGGTEPRYRTDGVVNESDDMSVVLDQFKSSSNSLIDDADGKIRTLVLANDLGSPVASFGADDIMGNVQWKPFSDLTDRFNIVRGTFTDPSSNSLYQSVEYPEVAIASADGVERAYTVDFPLVQSASQAQRLAKQRLQRSQYAGTLTCQMLSTAWRVQKNDVATFTFAPLGFTNKLFRLISTSVRIDGIVDTTWREENAAVYAWDMNESAPVSAAAPTTYSYTDNPLYQDLSTLPTYQDTPPGADGGVGHLYIDGTGKKFRFGGTTLTFGGDPLTFNGDPIYTSGYEDAQDQATVEALATAQDAQAAADAANAAIAQIDDDDIITISEKVEVLIPGAAAFEALYVAVVDNAATAGISITTLNTKRAAWLATLAAISPPWNDVTVASPVVRGSLDTARSEYDSELKDVQKRAIEAMTAAKQVTVVPPVAQIVYRDWQGNIKSGQYPRTLTPKVERGGTDIRTSNDVSYSVTTTGTIAATVNNTTGNADKGRITVTAGSSGSVLLTVTVLGVLQPVFTIPFTNQDDNPPTTGGGGGGSGNTGGSDSTLEDVTSTSFAAITQADSGESVFLIDITSGQTINGIAPLTYTKSGTNPTLTAMVAKWQYRLQGDPTWLDFAGSSITGTGAFYNSTDFIAESGEITANQSKSGLATGTYECQLVAAKSNSAAGNLQVVSGAATVSRT